MFCESMSEIEQLREAQIGRLKRSLHVDEFPAVNISDPILLPFLSPKVRAVVEAFPLQAEDIVRKHGLESEEFNKMLSETKANPIFRWKIQKEGVAGRELVRWAFPGETQALLEKAGWVTAGDSSYSLTFGLDPEGTVPEGMVARMDLWAYDIDRDAWVSVTRDLEAATGRFAWQTGSVEAGRYVLVAVLGADDMTATVTGRSWLEVFAR